MDLSFLAIVQTPSSYSKMVFCTIKRKRKRESADSRRRRVNSDRVCNHEVMKPATEMIEGPEAFTRFKTALKAVLTVPKSAMPPSPFKNSAPKKKKASRPKAS